MTHTNSAFLPVFLALGLLSTLAPQDAVAKSTEASMAVGGFHEAKQVIQVALATDPALDTLASLTTLLPQAEHLRTVADPSDRAQGIVADMNLMEVYRRLTAVEARNDVLYSRQADGQVGAADLDQLQSLGSARIDHLTAGARLGVQLNWALNDAAMRTRLERVVGANMAGMDLFEGVRAGGWFFVLDRFTAVSQVAISAISALRQAAADVYFAALPRSTRLRLANQTLMLPPTHLDQAQAAQLAPAMAAWAEHRPPANLAADCSAWLGWAENLHAESRALAAELDMPLSPDLTPERAQLAEVRAICDRLAGAETLLLPMDRDEF